MTGGIRVQRATDDDTLGDGEHVPTVPLEAAPPPEPLTRP
jgi:hypothetical protein